jgi:hypothetical protein
MTPIYNHRDRIGVPSLLNETHVALIQGPIAIYAASRNRQGIASLARALGARVSPDRRIVTVLLAASQSSGLLFDLRQRAPIAVVFCLPSTHQTIQLKAPHADIVNAGAEHHELMLRYQEAFAEELVRLGEPRQVVRPYLQCEPDDLIAVRFAPTAAFQQTPGPGAGTPLKAGESF